MDIKGVIGTASTVGGLLALFLSKSGQQHAADTVTACVDGVNHLGTDTVEVCKTAAKETASATRVVVAGVLTAFGSYFNFKSGK